MKVKEICVRSKELDWQPALGYPSGTMQKVIHDGSDDVPQCFMLKIEPACMMSEHSHIYTEMHYIVEGEYESNGEAYPEGTFRIIPAHTNHGPFTTIGGAVILVIWLDNL